MQDSIAPLHGLVLAGGKSQRMGHDKTVIDYHGIPHWQYLASRISSYCDSVFISKRADQEKLSDDAYPRLDDAFAGLGPFGGIVSAFKEYPNHAWLVVASDLPLADRAIEHLVANRNPTKLATAFHNETTGFLIHLLQFGSHGPTLFCYNFWHRVIHAPGRS